MNSDSRASGDSAPDRDALIPADLTRKALGTVYQFKMSVRVLDLESSKTLWVGVAEAKNLIYLEAVRGCCRLMVERMFGVSR